MAEKINAQSIRGWLDSHPGWSRKGGVLAKEYRFASFRDAIVFVNRVAGLADSLEHHPDIDIRYDRVLVTMSTHSAGGITEKDLALAEQLDHATSAG